jgi:hypothetical protein
VTLRVEIARLDVALLQLDWAIRLLLDHSAPIPAITLAAAADELSGKCISAGGSSETAHSTIKEALADQGYGCLKVVGTFMDAARNSLKHGGTSEKIELEPDSEAIQLIVRSIINAHRLRGELSGEMPRFLEWLRATRPDLFGKCG